MPLVQLLRNGQLTIPSKIRKALGLKRGDLLDVRLIEGKIILTPATPISEAKIKDKILTLLKRNWERNKEVPFEEIERIVSEAVEEVKEEERNLT
jgi:AbrB family looped-hinge helix DNA binding protein